MDILYRRNAATVAEIMNDLPDPPTYSAFDQFFAFSVKRS